MQHSFHLIGEIGVCLLRQLSLLMNFARYFCINFRAGEFFEQGGFVLTACFDEIGEAALGQHHGARELVVIEADDFVQHWLKFALVEGVFLRCNAFKRTLDCAVVVGSLESYIPFGPIACTIRCAELDDGISLLGSASQDVACVVGLQWFGSFFIGLGRDGLCFLHFLHVVETRRLIIERKANGIKHGAFSGSGVSGYGKETCRAQGFHGEIDGLFAFDGGEIADGDFIYLHVACANMDGRCAYSSGASTASVSAF